MATSGKSPRVILEANGLEKVFYTDRGRVHALHDVSFQIFEGEFACFVGPSGCGKTTILRILGGMLERTAGTVTLNGKDVRSASRELGVVFQQPNLLPWRSLLANTLLPLQVLGIKDPKYRQRAFELIKLVGLSGFEKQYPKELSGGMQQRAGIIRGLVHDPSILLMDEPFGALDAITREHMNLEILRIWTATRKTIIFVTHNIGEAVFLSDRVFVMTPSPGQIKETVTIDLPRPRTLDLLTDARFLDYERHIRKGIEKYYGFSTDTELVG